MIKLKKIFSLITTLLLLFSGFNTAFAQTAATGTLSFSPASFTVAQGANQTVSIVWTGAETSAAEIYFKPGTGLTVEAITAGTGLSEIFSDKAAGGFAVGKFDGNIKSGDTLATLTLKGSTVGAGTLSFDISQSNVPDVVITGNNATYTVTASGGGATRPPVDGSLPKTAIVSDEFDRILFSGFLISLGLGVAYMLKQFRLNTPKLDRIQIVNRAE